MQSLCADFNLSNGADSSTGARAPNPGEHAAVDTSTRSRVRRALHAGRQRVIHVTSWRRERIPS